MTRQRTYPPSVGGERVLSRQKEDEAVARIAYFRLCQRTENALAKKWDGFALVPMASWHSHRSLTCVEVNPFCDELVEDEVAKFSTEREAEAARQSFQTANEAVGLRTQVVVLGCSVGGKILTVDGEIIKLPSDEDGSDIPF